jgi:predicted O-methyltransferase YrrM
MVKKGASHLTVLRALFDAEEIKTVCEFGMGEFSTPWFCQHAETVLSIEDNARLWFDATRTACDRFKNWRGIFTERGQNWLAEFGERYDMIFVDGRKDNRPEIVNEAFKHADIIVAHDTEHKAYGWGRVNMPQGWERTDYKADVPWTSVWRKSDGI